MNTIPSNISGNGVKLPTIIKIMEIAGGNYIKVENGAYMPLTIERIGTGPRGLPAVSVCHYGEQNGDLMRDPEMCFEIDEAGNWHPYYFRNDYAGFERESVFVDEAGKVMVRPKSVREDASFARMWDRNIKNQGFVEAATGQKKAA